MRDKALIILVVWFAFCTGVLVGIWIIKHKAYEQTVSFSMGWNKEKDVWNKIRVDEEGKVICRKE